MLDGMGDLFNIFNTVKERMNNAVLGNNETHFRVLNVPTIIGEDGAVYAVVTTATNKIELAQESIKNGYVVLVNEDSAEGPRVMPVSFVKEYLYGNVNFDGWDEYSNKMRQMANDLVTSGKNSSNNVVSNVANKIDHSGIFRP